MIFWYDLPWKIMSNHRFFSFCPAPSSAKLRNRRRNFPYYFLFKFLTKTILFSFWRGGLDSSLPAPSSSQQLLAAPGSPRQPPAAPGSFQQLPAAPSSSWQLPEAPSSSQALWSLDPEPRAWGQESQRNFVLSLEPGCWPDIMLWVSRGEGIKPNTCI